jgi:hypothetical protein
MTSAYIVVQENPFNTFRPFNSLSAIFWYFIRESEDGQQCMGGFQERDNLARRGFFLDTHQPIGYTIEADGSG